MDTMNTMHGYDELRVCYGSALIHSAAPSALDYRGENIPFVSLSDIGAFE